MAARSHQPQELEVLWSSDDLVAINKPAGLATIPGRGETDSTFERLARQLGLPHKGEQDPRLRVVHRLDKETSGVLLFAKTVAAQRHLSHQFQNNAVEKEYLALVAGKPLEREGEIDAPITPHPTSKLHMTVHKRGRPARTLWRVEETFGQWSLVRCFPKTGKTHQIRVHLKHIGVPLAIDPLYNPQPPDAPSGLRLSQFKRGYRPTRGEEERPLIDRLTLHAHKLRFRDTSDQLVEVEAELPKGFRAVLNQLRKSGRR